jgi:hypothetical protein
MSVAAKSEHQFFSRRPNVNRRIAKSATQPARKSLTAVSLSIAALFAVPTAHAFELKLEDGWKGSLDTTVSLGTSWRMQSADPSLYSRASGIRVNPADTSGTGGSNTDSGNLNWDKGDHFSTLLKVTSDLSLNKGDMGAFARVKAWYDYALEDQEVRAGNHGTNWTRNAKLSDSGYDRLQKFSGIALLDAYVYNTFDIAGKPLQLRLGNQVINWGESLFIQGVNQINPIDLSALRKPGAEVKEAFLPITALAANLGLGGGRSLEAFYQFRWAPSNIDSCGAYFGVVETQLTPNAGGACSRMLTALSTNPLTGAGLDNFQAFNSGLYIPMVNGREGSDSGQFGVALRLPVPALDAEMGLYAVRIGSRLPYVSGLTGTNRSLLPLLDPRDGTSAFPFYSSVPTSGPQAIAGTSGLLTLAGGFPAGFVPRPGSGFWEYPENMKVFGASFAKNISGWSVGAEVSQVVDQPAQINANDLLAALLSGVGPMGQVGRDATVAGGLEGGTEVSGFDRVKKTQLQVNAVRIFPRILNSAQGIVVGEVAYQKSNIRSDRRYGRAFIFGSGYDPRYDGGTLGPTGWCAAGIAVNTQKPDGCKNDGYVTKNSWGYRLRLGLEYPNVLNTGVTLFPTFSFSHDVDGYSVDNQFIEDRKVYGASFRFNIQRVHNIELSYIQYGDSAKYDPFRDRDFMSLVFSTTF